MTTWQQYGHGASTTEETVVQRLEAAPTRVARPRSQVVREAILDYADRVGRLIEPERREQLNVIDQHARTKPTRTAADVDRELAEIRTSRRAAGRPPASR